MRGYVILTHENAERRYTEIRLATLAAISKNYPASLGLNFRLVDELALTATKAWPKEQRRIDLNWVAGYPAFRFRYPKRFELALWQNGSLATLALGRPTSKCGGIRLDFLEATPLTRDIRVVPVVLATMVAYATALGANEIRLVEPINEAVRKYYERFGLTYVRKGDYLFKIIG